MLAPRAEEHELFNHALNSVRKVRAKLGSIGRTIGAPDTPQMLEGELNAIARACQARPVADAHSLSGRIGRMLDPMWWTRNLRKQLLRENETIERAQCRIRRKAQVYVTDHTAGRRAARDKQNRATLERMEVVNEDGQALNLAEVAEGSVSNPKLRRSELMTRCRGFEETAAFMGHVGLFLTLTCPSRFHRFNSSGKPNKKWTGETQKDGQEYLCGVWQKIRAAWQRRGFMPYGFRVAEPHHEGCPHWHILLFVAPEAVGWFRPENVSVKPALESGWIAPRQRKSWGFFGAGVLGIAGTYAMDEAPGEYGAVEHRFTCVRIEAGKGSATGYIAKYICKNIDGLKEDGEQMGLDFDSGKKASDASKRVRDWAGVHGIRQFQQIGGPSVTVWRELRRLGKGLEQPLQNELFEGPRAAADRALWALFWVLQGGPDVKRKDLTLKPAYLSDSQGKYGDEVERVWGVSANDGTDLQTRIHTWTVQRAGLNAVNVQQAERREYMAVQAGAEAWVQAAGFDSVSDFQDREAGPWTRVNNCTDDDQKAMRLDAMRGPGGVNFRGWEGKLQPESLIHEQYSNPSGGSPQSGSSYP